MERYDLVVVGSGPAGITAALYAARARLKVKVIGKDDVGSLINTHKIDNYPGFEGEPTGREIINKMKTHSKKFGVEYEEATFLELDVLKNPKIVKTDNKIIEAVTVVIATGWPKNNSSKLSGEAEFIGRGVSYCATCDGAFCKGMTVGVFGQGEEAAEEALYLTQHADKILFYVSDEGLICDEELKNKIISNEKVEMKYGYKLKKIDGTDFVETAIVEKLGIEEESKVDAAFLYLGTKSNSELFSTFANLDEEGYIITNEKMETYIEGVYAAGDVRKKELRQIATAVSDGAIAGVEAIKYVMKNKK